MLESHHHLTRNQRKRPNFLMNAAIIITIIAMVAALFMLWISQDPPERYYGKVIELEKYVTLDEEVKQETIGYLTEIQVANRFRPIYDTPPKFYTTLITVETSEGIVKVATHYVDPPLVSTGDDFAFSIGKWE